MTRLTRRISRLPLRVRLVAGFSVTMFLVLAAAGGFVYWRVEYALDRLINDELTETASMLAPLVGPNGRLSDKTPRLATDETYQVVDRNGDVLSSSSPLGSDPLLSSSLVRSAASAPVRRDIGKLLPIHNRPLRAYAVALPEADTQRAAVLVVAVRRDHRDEALLELLGQLIAAGLGALILTGLVGERLAHLALRPVERYRSQAAGIVDGATGVRLDVPRDRDDEITRLGHTLNSMLDALEAALDRERQFVNDASHELRTPLTLLRTRVQLALRRPRTLDQHETVLAEIETDIVGLTRLAHQLLRVGTSQLRAVGTETSDLADLARREVARRNQLAAEHEGEVPRETIHVSAPSTTAALMARRLGRRSGIVVRGLGVCVASVTS